MFWYFCFFCLFSSFEKLYDYFVNLDLANAKTHSENTQTEDLLSLEIDNQIENNDSIQVTNEKIKNDSTIGLVASDQSDISQSLIQIGHRNETIIEETNQNIETENLNENSEITEEEHLVSQNSNLASASQIEQAESIGSEENSRDIRPIQIIDFQHEWDQLSDNEKMLGLLAPIWLPDNESESCMKCGIKFSFRRRRHHCRACGLIFCSACCNLKLMLPYRISKSSNNSSNNDAFNTEAMSDANTKESSRVCILCYETINKVNELRLNLQKSFIPNTPVSVLKKTNASSAINIENSSGATTSNWQG
jgi:hypothetical protein